jgi:hypothetical protein
LWFIDFCGVINYFLIVSPLQETTLKRHLAGTIVVLLCSFFLRGLSVAQEEEGVPPSAAMPGHRDVFDEVQRGFSAGDVGLIARHFASPVALGLRGEENGSFSANQAYYILQDFLKTRRVGGFTFAVVDDTETSPYASAEAELVQRGGKERVQVYVALSLVGKRFLITQLTIY